MGILTKQLIINDTYWLFELPQNDKSMTIPKIMSYTSNIYQPDKADKGRNYHMSYCFDDIIIVDGYFDNDMKCYMENIDNFIITTNFRKMFDIIKNHLKLKFRETLLKDQIDINQLADYVRVIEQNNPELLI